MLGVNQQIIMGNVGVTPYVSQTKQGRDTISFPVAIDEIVRGENVALWVDVVMVGKLASQAAGEIKLGDILLIIGKAMPPNVFKNRAGEYTSVPKVLARRYFIIDNPNSKEKAK